MENLEKIEYKIDDARPEDVEKMRMIARNWWVSLYPNEKFGITREDIEAVDWFNADQIEKRRRRISEDGNFHAWVLKDKEGNIIGFCQVTKKGRQEDQKEIEAMYIVSEFKSKGLGRKLMDCALDWLGSDGDIALEVVSYNKNAIDFYKKFGFVETNWPVGDKRTKLPSGKKIPRIVMVRPKYQSQL